MPQGMAEAVGSLYEAAAGIDPMTRWELPLTSTVAAAQKNLQAHEAATLWQAVAPDRVLSLTADAAGNITAISLDGSASVFSKIGKLLTQKPVSATPVTAAKKIAAAKPTSRKY